MMKSASCEGYYTLSQGEVVLQGHGRCSACQTRVESVSPKNQMDLFSQDLLELSPQTVTYMKGDETGKR